jgi:hypothetical protein
MEGAFGVDGTRGLSLSATDISSVFQGYLWQERELLLHIKVFIT